MPTRTAVSTPGGVVRVGDWVNYTGSRWYLVASLWEVLGFCEDGTVRVSNGVITTRMRPGSIKPERKES